MEGHPLRIECATAVFEDVRAAAVDGFCKFPRGGIEIGGVLFGAAGGGLVRILALRPVACEYARGPSYVLSERDEQVLRNVLEGVQRDPLLAGLQPVGWYHSHTRRGLFLSPQDLELHRRYFPAPWQVALVVRPEPFGTCRGGFFFQETDGTIRHEAPCDEFVIPVGGLRARSGVPAAFPIPEQTAKPHSQAALREGVAESPRAHSAQADLEDSPPPGEVAPLFPEDSPAPWRGWWKWIALPLAFALFAVAGGFAARAYWRARQPEALSLRVLDVGGQLQIAWNGNARSVREAQRGALEILDGSDQALLKFDREKLRRGSVTYARRSENVEVHLSVDRAGGAPIEEFARFLGKPLAAPAAPPPVVATAAAPELPAARPPQVPMLGPRLDTRAAVQSAAPSLSIRRSFDMNHLARRVPQKHAAPAAVPPPPLLASTGGVHATPLAFAPGRVAVMAPPPAPAPVSAPVRKEPPSEPAYAGPRSGRMIWTGQLDRGASLSLDGARASSGFVTGELPGVPVHISAHPAELSSRGLIVFAPNPHREPPGPSNGWNETTYSWDARRANDILVLEAPAAHNSWKRVVVRADNRPVAVVVIDWKIAVQ